MLGMLMWLSVCVHILALHPLSFTCANSWRVIIFGDMSIAKDERGTIILMKYFRSKSRNLLLIHTLWQVSLSVGPHFSVSIPLLVLSYETQRKRCIFRPGLLSTGIRRAYSLLAIWSDTLYQCSIFLAKISVKGKRN